MKKQSGIQQDQESDSNQQLDPLAHPMARTTKGSATREEIRSQTVVLSAPRQSNRPMERSRQPRTRKR